MTVVYLELTVLGFVGWILLFGDAFLKMLKKGVGVIGDVWKKENTGT